MFYVRTIVALFCCSGLAQAQGQAISLKEDTAKREFRVIVETVYFGELTLPGEKGKAGVQERVSGRSELDYHEKTLPADPQESDAKTIRSYEKIDLIKKTSNRQDQLTLRPDVRRIIMLKKGNRKNPFSPDGPLTFAEVDMLKREFIMPTMTGLLPPRAVRLDDAWILPEQLVSELTEIEKVDKGTIRCTLSSIDDQGARKTATVTFTGEITGINEDGPSRQKIKGKYIFDLGKEMISYFEIDGEQFFIDEKGAQLGKITGSYKLVRSLADANPHRRLTDDELKKTPLGLTDETGKMLFDQNSVKFAFPRRWKVVRSEGWQMTLDEATGSGLLITLDTTKNVPTTNEYVKQALKEIEKLGGRLKDRQGPEKLTERIDHFSLIVEFEKDQVTLDYYIVRQNNGGATFAGSLRGKERQDRMKEVERIVRSFEITQELKEK